MFPQEPNARMDISATAGTKTFAVDVAITHVFAGRPTEYERVKTERYGALVAQQRDVELVPLVVDTFCGWGDSAVPFLRRAACRWGSGVDLLPCRSIPISFARLNFVVAKGVAAILLRGLIDPSAQEHAATMSGFEAGDSPQHVLTPSSRTVQVARSAPAFVFRGVPAAAAGPTPPPPLTAMTSATPPTPPPQQELRQAEPAEEVVTLDDPSSSLLLHA
jgi:hypothetical protein